MSYGACDACRRVFAVGSESDAHSACPSCRSPLRAATVDEAVRGLHLGTAVSVVAERAGGIDAAPIAGR